MAYIAKHSSIMICVLDYIGHNHEPCKKTELIEIPFVDLLVTREGPMNDG